MSGTNCLFNFFVVIVDKHFFLATFVCGDGCEGIDVFCCFCEAVLVAACSILFDF